MYEDEEKKVDDHFKPSIILYIFLFLFYAVWIWNIYGYIKYCIQFGFDEFTELTPYMVCCGVFMMATSVYGFYSTIKTLRGDPDCITSLKWALIYAFLYAFFDENRLVPTTNYGLLVALFMIKPLFYLSFYLYLCFDKGIRRRYHKANRRFGKSGWIWTGFTTLLVGLGVYGGYQEYRTSEYCKPKDLDKLVLSEDEYSDGVIILKSSSKWESLANDSSYMYIEDILECAPALAHNDSTSHYMISSGRCDKPSERIHNHLVFGMMEEMEADLREIAHIDTLINGNRMIATRFEGGEDDHPAFFTIASLAQADNVKYAVIQCVEKLDCGFGNVINIAKGITFDLESRLIDKRIDDKAGNNDEKSTSNRIGNGKQEYDTDFLAALNKGFTPSHTFGIMLLEYDKRIQAN